MIIGTTNQVTFFAAGGRRDWTIVFDDGSEQVFTNVSGSLVLTAADLNRKCIKSYSTVWTA